MSDQDAKIGHNGGPALQPEPQLPATQTAIATALKEPLPEKLVPLPEFYEGNCSKAAAFLWIKQGRLKAWRFGGRTWTNETFIEFVVRQDAEQREANERKRAENAAKRWGRKPPEGDAPPAAEASQEDSPDLVRPEPAAETAKRGRRRSTPSRSAGELPGLPRAAAPAER